MSFGPTYTGVNLWSTMKTGGAPAAPSLSLSNRTQQTGQYIIYDSVEAYALTDDTDGVTTKVELYVDGVLFDTMIEGAPDGTLVRNWTMNDRKIPAGSRSYFARRYVGASTVDSATTTINALDVLAGNQLTSCGAIYFWGRTLNGESIQMASSLATTAAATVGISSTSSLVGRSEEITFTITTGGAPGVSKGTLNLNGVVTTNVSTGANVGIPTTDLTLHFTSPSYSVGQVFRSACNNFLDKIGAYPVSANNFSQATMANQGLIKRGQLGTPCVKIDGSNDSYATLGPLAANAYGGTDKTHFTVTLAYLTAFAGAAGFSCMWCASNITDTDLPRVELVLNGGANPVTYRTARVGDTGTAKTFTSQIPTNSGGGYLYANGFDGTHGKVTINTADVIGGENPDVTADQSGLTITPDRVTLGARRTQAGSSGFLNGEIYEHFVAEHAPTDPVEAIQFERYFQKNYPAFTLYYASDIRWAITGFSGAVQGYAAQYWWGGGDGIGTGLMVPTDNTNTNATQEGWRMMRRKDGSLFWYTKLTGDDALEIQSIEEQIDSLYYAGVTCINILYYINLPQFPSRNGDPLSRFIWWYDQFVLARNKRKLKWSLGILSGYASFDANSPTFIPVSPGTWLNLPDQIAYWVSLVQNDPDYEFSDAGRPIIRIFDALNTWDQAHLDQITTGFTDAGLQPPIYLYTGTGLGNGTYSYGPTSGILPSTGQNPYSARVTKDVNFDLNPNNRARQWGIDLVDDSRPVNGSSQRWADTAIYLETEQHFLRRTQYCRSIRNLGDTFKGIYIYGYELAEGGAVFPAVQMYNLGPNGNDQGPFLDASRNVNRADLPDTFTCWYAADNIKGDITQPAGTWATTVNINNGGLHNPAPHEFKVRSSSSAGARYRVAPTRQCTRIRVYGTLKATGGTSNWATNGGAATLVNQFNASTLYTQPLYDTGVLALGNNVAEGTEVAGLNEYDLVAVDYVR